VAGPELPCNSPDVELVSSCFFFPNKEPKKPESLSFSRSLPSLSREPSPLFFFLSSLLPHLPNNPFFSFSLRGDVGEGVDFKGGR
jgi:hypothetical protein